MAKVTQEALNKVSETWVKATKGCEVVECFKCSGNGKYYYQNGTQGICYACNGVGLLPSKEAKEANLEYKKRHITQAEFKDNFLVVYYLAYNVSTQALEGWKRIWDMNNPVITESQREQLRAIYYLGITR